MTDYSTKPPAKLLHAAGACWRHGMGVGHHHQRHEQREGIIAQIVILGACGIAAIVMVLLALVIGVFYLPGWVRQSRREGIEIVPKSTP